MELHHRPLAEPSGNSRLTRLPSSKRADHTDPPVNEEIRSLRDKPLKKMARTDLVVFKAFELSYHPGQYRLIDVSEQGVQRRWSISPVVLNPAPEEWIELPGNVVQRQLSLMTNIQVPNRQPHGFHRRGADCRIESAEQRFIPETLNQTGPKAVPKEVKLDVRIGAFALSVFAVDDLGFCRMQL